MAAKNTGSRASSGKKSNSAGKKARGNTTGKTATKAKNDNKAAVKAKTSGGGKKTASSKAGGSTKNTGRNNNQNTSIQNQKTDQLYQELLWAGLVLVCIFLLVADLGMGGSFGNSLRSLQFGLFGSTAYLFPAVFIFLCIAVYAGSDENGIPTPQVAAGLILFLSLCGLIGMIGGQGGMAGKSLADFYLDGTQGLNGGVFGGIICVNLVTFLGSIITYLLLIFTIAVCAIILVGRNVLSLMYYRRQKIRKRTKELREQARERERLKREEWELAQEEEEFRRREEALELRKRRDNMEARRSALRARSLAFGEATRLEPDLSEDESVEMNAIPGKLRSDEVEDKTINIEETAGNSEEAEQKAGQQDPMTFTGTIHGAEPVRPYQPMNYRQTLSELEALDQDPANDIGNVLPRDGMVDLQTGEILESMPTTGTESADSVELPEEQKLPDGQDHASAGELEAGECYDDDPYNQPLDTSDWMNAEAGEIHIARDTYEPGQGSGLHPAAEDFSSEESMSAYDEFQDGPLPEEILAQNSEMPAAQQDRSRGGTAGRRQASSDSIWRSGDKQEGNSGARFSDLTVQPKEEPVIKREYRFPSMELLKEPARKGGMSEDQLRNTAVKLQQTLRNFGVGVTVTDISCGPTVTRYELQPDQGVKVSRIVNLTDDIKLNLAASDIRIEAPIPGKAAVGIEVPNSEKQMVSLKELLDSDEFRRMPSKVSFGVGKDIAGKVMVADLARMPHLLIAGSTGSGKSVCINSIIVSILYKAHPDDVKLIMIDPKVVELSVYNGIPHLMIPVVTDPKKAAAALNWAVVEMNDRYRKFAETGCRDIKGYNRKVEGSDEAGMEKMPQIIVIVDELADLMMVAAGEVEEAICRLAQLARAAGIHLVLATQRPSVDVITGLIKANVPSRIAFAVSSTTDSRTIIDMGGAEKLLGNGDMMFYPAGYPKPVRVQGAFVSDDEVSAVVEELVSQKYGMPGGSHAIEKQLDQMKDAGTVGAGSRDELFEKAGRYIIDKEKASIGNLQRMFRIGFNRAARIMDQLADYGVVGPEEGTKARQILMNMEQFDELMKDL